MGVALAFWLQMALLAADAAPLSDPSADAPLFATPTRLDRIGRVVAPVLIDGKGPYRLVVDTGASHSTFSPQLAAALGLAPSFDSPLWLNGVTGSVSVPSVTVGYMQVGDMVVRDAQVPVLETPIMADADGILGMAGLREGRMLVDFRNDRIVIARAGKRIDTDGFLRIPARRISGGLLMLDGRIGGVPARVVIDTGAERTLGNVALRDALRKRRRGMQWIDIDVYGATAEVVKGQASLAPRIELGPVAITKTVVVYGEFHIFSLWNLDSRPAALIGMDVLGTVPAMVLDYARREIYFDLRPDRTRTASSKRAAAMRFAEGGPCRVTPTGTHIARSGPCP